MERRLLDYRPETEGLEEPFRVRERAEALTAGEEERDAAELLERLEEGELEDYLVELIDRAGRVPDRRVTHTLAGTLGRAARRVLRRGDAPPASAGRILGLELEGLSPEDQTFEVAKQIVRLASEAARRAGRGGAGAPSAVDAWRAFDGAARSLAPGLLPPPGRRESRASGFVARTNSSSSTPRPVPNAIGALVSQKEPAMHDMDRTEMEYDSEAQELEAEFEFEEGEWGAESGAVLSEADEFELANELLGVSSEEELDQFLGKLIKTVAQSAGKAIRSPLGQAVGGVLKGVAKKALPLAGGALGTFVGGPLGAKIGSGMASAAGNVLGLEGETLAQEDHEFEGAKQFVRVAADTVDKAVTAPPSADPQAVAQSAAVTAAGQLAPGLIKSGGRPGRRHSGRWVRRGHTIVILGA